MIGSITSVATKAIGASAKTDSPTLDVVMGFESDDASTIGITTSNATETIASYFLTVLRLLIYNVGIVMTLRHGKDMYLDRKGHLAKSRRKASRRASPHRHAKANPAPDMVASANVMLYSSDHEQEPVSRNDYKTKVEPLPDSDMTEPALDNAEALSDFQDCDDPTS